MTAPVFPLPTPCDQGSRRVIDCIASELVTEATMVVDGGDYVLVLPKELEAVAQQVASLCSGIQTVGRAGVADEKEGAA